MAASRSAAYGTVHSDDIVAGVAPLSGGLRIIEVRDLSTLDAAAWGALVASAKDATVFQGLDWLVSWWEAFGGRRTPLVLMAKRDTEVVGAAPLYIDHGRWRRCIRFIGENHADYLTFIARADAVEIVDRLLNYLERGYAARYDLHFTDVPDTSALGLMLQLRQRSMPLRLMRTAVTPCPRLRITGNELQVEKALNKKSLKRHAAKLVAQGPVEVRHLTDAQTILVQLEQFFEQHRRRWAVTPFASLFEEEADRHFYRKLVESQLSNGSLVLTTVRVGGRLAACHFGLISNADFIWYKPSFDVLLSHLSPGEVLLRELLLLTRERGFEHFDFTRGDEAFKSRFSSEIRYNGTYLIYAHRVDALAACTRALILRALQQYLPEASGTGRFLRQLNQTIGASREAGAGLPRAALISIRLAARIWRQWLFSRSVVHLFSTQGSPPAEADESVCVHEANLEYLLEAPTRLRELLAANRQFLPDAYKRLAQGERCFVIVEKEIIAAVGWANPRSPHPVTELEAVLHFPGQVVVLNDYYVVQRFRGRGLYPRLLTGIRLALGTVPALIYADDSNVASLKGIRRAGFTLEAAIENRVLFGRHRLAVRPVRPQMISWDIIRR